VAEQFRFDLRDTALAQVAWLRDAGFEARVAWEHKDLALLVADLR
jgi:hypothetical protein